MANDLISSLLSPPSLKITNSTTGAVVASSIKISRVSFKLNSTPMRHMKEDGSTKVDSRIILPTSLVLEIFCPDANAATQVNQILQDRTSFYSITSKGLIFDNLMCESEQLSQTPDVMSALPVRLSFKQVLSKKVKPIVFAQQADSSLVSRGMSLLSEAKSTVTDLFNSVSRII